MFLKKFYFVLLSECSTYAKYLYTSKSDYLNDPPISYREWDKNKYYTSILKDLPFIPYVNEFENFEFYNNEPIQDHYIYFVEKKSKLQSYPIYPFSLCFGINIKKLTGLKIIPF